MDFMESKYKEELDELQLRYNLVMMIFKEGIRRSDPDFYNF